MNSGSGRKPKPGMHWVQLVGSARWTVAERQADETWLTCGSDVPLGAVLQWVRIEPSNGVDYEPC